MRRCWERLLLILTLATPEPVELGSSLAALAVGTWLLWPGGQFAHWPVMFRPMKQIAPQWAWALFLLAVGTLQFRASACGQRKARRVAAFIALASWAFVAAMFVRGDLRAIGIPLWFLGAASNGWIFLRLGPWWWQAHDEA